MDKTSVLILLTVLFYHIAVTSATMDEWEEFKQKYNKVYSNKAEESMRRAYWVKHRHFVDAHNAAYERGHHRFSLSLNQHADMTHESHHVMRFGSTERQNMPSQKFRERFFTNYDVRDLPASVDWRKKGFVSDVMDQGECSSSYAFAGLGAIEGQFANKTGKLVTLSAQNVVDCSHLTGSDGCNGGFVDTTLDYDGFTRGINTEAEYPYTGREGQCRFNSTTKVSGIGGYVILSGLNETWLQIAVATVGPIAAIMDASSPFFRFYEHGVLVDTLCRKTFEYLLHTVLIVGYGTSEFGDDYWIVRNSWGKDWGMDGYALMARNHDNMCGLSYHPVYPDVLL